MPTDATGDPSARQIEIALVEGLARHDETALRDLIDTCGRYVYGRALQILREPHLAEEVAQDTLLILWWEPDCFDVSRGSLRTFLMGAARHKAIDLVRHEEAIRAKESFLIDTETFLESPAADRGVEDAIVVRAAISKLPIAKREVIFLAYYRGLTYKQAAQVLGIPEGTVKTRIRDALITLRTVIGPAQAS